MGCQGDPGAHTHMASYRYCGQQNTVDVTYCVQHNIVVKSSITSSLWTIHTTALPNNLQPIYKPTKHHHIVLHQQILLNKQLQ